MKNKNNKMLIIFWVSDNYYALFPLGRCTREWTAQIDGQIDLARALQAWRRGSNKQSAPGLLPPERLYKVKIPNQKIGSAHV